MKGLWPQTGLWRHRDFLALWAGQAVSALGSRITRTALPVIAVLAVDGSPAELGLLAALSVAPGALVGLFAGGFIDRSRKRSILIVSDLVRALLCATIPLLAWLGTLSMLHLYLVAAAIGAATSLFQIADNTYLPVLIGRAQLAEGNAKLETTESVAEIAGPGLTGVLIEILSAPVTLVFDALSYLASTLCLSAIRATEAAPGHIDSSSAPSWRTDLDTGWRAIMNRPVVRALFLTSAMQTFVFGFLFALYMLFTLDTLGLSPGAVGAIISVGGVGGLLGAVLAGRLGAALGAGRGLVLACLGSQLALALVPAASGTDGWSIGLLLGQQFFGDVFLIAFTVLAVTARQSELPIDVLGRANGLFQAAASALLPLGALTAGALAEYLDVRTALWLGVGLGLCAPLLLWPARAWTGESSGPDSP